MTQPSHDRPTTPSPALARTPATVRDVQWSSVLEFTHLFKSFRLAINPAKIILALLAIMAIYCSGRIFDLAWGPQVFDGEIEAYQSFRPELYKQMRDTAATNRAHSLQTLLSIASASTLEPMKETDLLELSQHPRASYNALKGYYKKQFHTTIKQLALQRKEAQDPHYHTAEVTNQPERSPREAEQEGKRNAANRLLQDMTIARTVVGRGIFDAFLTYELKQFDALIDNTLTFVRVSPVRTSGISDMSRSDENAVSGSLLSKNPDRLWRSDTVVGCIANMTITAPMWLFSATAPIQYHADGNPASLRTMAKTFGYRMLYLASLLVLAVLTFVIAAHLGAVISRLSALEFSGFEQPNLFHAVKFARGHLPAFLKAPLLPFAIILFLGLATAAVSLLGAIPFAGEIIVGLIFIVFLIVGFIVMLLMLGLLGGFNLLYPTLAVEGSDSFDALSRAFAYVYARPWRLVFYAILNLVYFIVTILFISFAVYLLLAFTHAFVSWGMTLFGMIDGAYSGLPKLETMWPVPRVNRLIQPINWWAMSGTEFIGACFLHFWIFTIVTCIGAYAVSYYFSSNTILYLLLRRAEDGQGLTEISRDDADESAVTTAPAGASPSSTPAKNEPGAAGSAASEGTTSS